jgi:hypothetical protein
MNIQGRLVSCSIAVIAACICGCVSHRTSAEGCYAWHMSTWNVADAGTTAVLKYKPARGREHRLWPRLPSGEYGHYLIRDGLIIFQANRTRRAPDGYEFDPGIFAGKFGPPAADITKAVLRAAAKSGIKTSDVYLRDTGFAASDSGVSVSLLRWTGPAAPGQSELERQEFVFTWQELADWVDSVRSGGVKHEFKGVEYYAEE